MNHCQPTIIFGLTKLFFGNKNPFYKAVDL
jgi:hypothetical protein